MGQRFCPRIVAGELRLHMIGDACTDIIHKKPKAGGLSAECGTGSVYAVRRSKAASAAQPSRHDATDWLRRASNTGSLRVAELLRRLT